MRIGEILGLTWDCVHIEDDLVEQDEAYLIVDKELRRSDKRSVEKLRAQGRDDIFFTFPAWKQTESTTVLVLKTPKTESSVRSIYIPQTVAKALREQKEAQERFKQDLGSEYQDFNLVVAQENGRPHEERQIAAKFNRLIRKHNLRPVVFHSLRHSSTSLKLKISGGDIKTVQKDTGERICQGLFLYGTPQPSKVNSRGVSYYIVLAKLLLVPRTTSFCSRRCGRILRSTQNHRY